MKKRLVWVVILAFCWCLFAEGNPRPQHTCSNYWQKPDEFVPDWFEYLEFADNNISAYNREFLQEHGGRVGVIIYGQKIKNCSGFIFLDKQPRKRS